VTKNDDDRDGRNAVTRGYVLATRVTSIGMQMALPPAIGWWADKKFNTEPWLLCLGAILGLTISLIELVRLAKESDDSKS
jgi:F0F1-type ATP synthase assembly protein I